MDPEQGSTTSSLGKRNTGKDLIRLAADVLEMKNEGIKYIVFMVGLPARGKSYICKKLAKYLNWCGFTTRIFNVGNRRRGDSKEAAAPNSTSHDSKFFDASNAEAAAVREKLVMSERPSNDQAAETLEELISWLHFGGGKVAIHDATNSTLARRKTLRDRVSREKGIKAVFIESICPDPELLEENIKMKLQGPDYKDMDPEVAIKDFKSRIENYEKVYQTISEEEEIQNMSYIKIINVGRKVIAHHITGYVPSQMVFYLMQMNIVKRTIWLTRHGESEYNVLNKIGGNPGLTEKGRRYSHALYDFIANYDAEDSTKNFEKKFDSRLTLNARKMRVFTSTLKRAIQTAEVFDPEFFEVTSVKFLNEIYSGNFEGMTYEDIQTNYPEEYQARLQNKLMYRYPGAGGESYADVIERLKPIIIELERMRSDAMVISHNVTMRTLLAYSTGVPLADVPKIKVPLHTLYCLEPKAYGAEVSRYAFNETTGEMEFVGKGIVQ
ncbi:hypothetical protein HDU91_004806 [Kappamyces sp. JEL0680]|nr:hypothetical protein HDU91_004806 [Kappamyces sp. JEL0680]